MATNKTKMAEVVVTKSGRLNWGDALKSAIIGIGTPIIYVIQEMIPNWPLNPIEKAAVSATVTYLIKNFFNESIKEVK